MSLIGLDRNTHTRNSPYANALASTYLGGGVGGAFPDSVYFTFGLFD